MRCWASAAFLVASLTLPARAQEPGERPTLGACLDEALSRNPAIQKAKAQLERSQGSLIVARSAALPDLYLAGQLTETDPERLDRLNGLRFGSPTDWNGAINLEQTLYAGGAVQAGVKMARLRETRSLWDFQQVVNDTLLKVREQFYAALLAQRQVEVQRESLHLLDEELGSIRRRFQAGTLPRFNVLRAEVELANGKPALIRAENQWRLSLEDLARLLGMQPDEARLRGVTGGLGQPSMDWNLSEALEEARLRRPEIQSRRRQREMQEQNVVIQEAGWKPSLQAFGNYGYQKERFTSSFDQENHGWMVGVKGRIPLFDGLETYGKVAEAKADLRTADWDVSQAELDVEYDVRRAYSEITEAAELIRASQTADSQAREGLREARVRFDAGAGTQLEVLDARVAMTSARLNSLQALHDYNLALARLRRAMGVDHVFRYETEPSP